MIGGRCVCVIGQTKTKCFFVILNWFVYKINKTGFCIIGGRGGKVVCTPRTTNITNRRMIFNNPTHTWQDIMNLYAGGLCVNFLNDFRVRETKNVRCWSFCDTLVRSRHMRSFLCTKFKSIDHAWKTTIIQLLKRWRFQSKTCVTGDCRVSLSNY